MSREIEYRAWHKEDKKMLHVCGADWMINLERDCVEISAVNCAERRSDGWVNGGSHDIEDVILMQYTGIKDKNGVKIYEGDVVVAQTLERSPLSLDYVSGFLKGVIVYYDNSFCILSDDTYYPHWTNAAELEVIGNIHEEKLGEQ